MRIFEWSWIREHLSIKALSNGWLKMDAIFLIFGRLYFSESKALSDRWLKMELIFQFFGRLYFPESKILSQVTWVEATAFLVMYVLYCIAMGFNSTFEAWAMNLPVMVTTMMTMLAMLMTMSVLCSNAMGFNFCSLGNESAGKFISRLIWTTHNPCRATTSFLILESLRHF